MQQGMLRPEEQKIIQTADNVANLLNSSSEWTSQYLKDVQVRKGMERFLKFH